MREQRFLGELQNSDCVLATHCRKVLQEMIERIPFFEVVEESLHRNPGARKHHGPAHHLIRPRDKEFPYSLSLLSVPQPQAGRARKGVANAWRSAAAGAAVVQPEMRRPAGAAPC